MRFYTLLLCLFLTSLTIAQSEKEMVLATVDKNTIESHIYFLSDDLLEGREAGTRGNKIAASYLANQLKSYGVKPIPETNSYYQSFDLQQTSAPKKLSISLNGTDYPLHLAFTMPEMSQQGEALFLGYGLADDFKNKDVEGKLIIVQGGTGTSEGPSALFRHGREKRERAAALGALGLVEFVSFEEGMWSQLKHYMASRTELPDGQGIPGADTFAHLWLNDNGSFPDFKKGAKVPFSLVSDGRKFSTVKTQNVIGVIEGTDPQLKNEYIIYSAHYDHVGIGRPNAEGDSIYNGARDNNIGVTAVLSMAENLSKYPTKRSALFILFTAEEKGLLGSSYYVEHPVVPLKQMAYCFNTDGGGYNNKSLATIVGLERTSAKKHILEGASTFGLKAIEDPAPEQNFFDRSDNVNFARKGIPAPTYSTGMDAFDAEIMKYYHQVEDEADSLDFDYLLQFYQGYVLSGRLIANDPEQPTWVSGDKYEEAFNKLHGKVN